MYRSQRTHEVHSTRRPTAPRITHQHPHMPRSPSTPQLSSAPQTTPRPTARPPTKLQQRTSPHTAEILGTAQRAARKRKKTLHLSSPWPH